MAEGGRGLYCIEHRIGNWTFFRENYFDCLQLLSQIYPQGFPDKMQYGFPQHILKPVIKSHNSFCLTSHSCPLMNVRSARRPLQQRREALKVMKCRQHGVWGAVADPRSQESLTDPDDWPAADPGPGLSLQGMSAVKPAESMDASHNRKKNPKNLVCTPTYGIKRHDWG